MNGVTDLTPLAFSWQGFDRGYQDSFAFVRLYQLGFAFTVLTILWGQFACHSRFIMSNYRFQVELALRRFTFKI